MSLERLNLILINTEIKMQNQRDFNETYLKINEAWTDPSNMIIDRVSSTVYTFHLSSYTLETESKVRVSFVYIRKFWQLGDFCLFRREIRQARLTSVEWYEEKCSIGNLFLRLENARNALVKTVYLLAGVWNGNFSNKKLSDYYTATINRKQWK
jgi:hypothetical protein